MAKSKDGGPIGNQDDSKRGRGVDRTTKNDKAEDKNLPDGVDGQGIGGRGKK